MNKEEFLLLIDEICGVEQGTVSANDSINGTVIFDSIALLGLIAMLDKKFGLNFSMDDLNKVNTIGNLYDKVMA